MREQSRGCSKRWTKALPVPRIDCFTVYDELKSMAEARLAHERERAADGARPT